MACAAITQDPESLALHTRTYLTFAPTPLQRKECKDWVALYDYSSGGGGGGWGLRSR